MQVFPRSHFTIDIVVTRTVVIVDSVVVESPVDVFNTLLYAHVLPVHPSVQMQVKLAEP